MRRSAEFLEFAAVAGGFGVFDLDLITGGIGGTPLFFDLIGLPSRNESLTREEWVATIHPEDLGAVVIELGAAIDAGTQYQAEYRSKPSLNPLASAAAFSSSTISPSAVRASPE